MKKTCVLLGLLVLSSCGRQGVADRNDNGNYNDNRRGYYDNGRRGNYDDGQGDYYRDDRDNRRHWWNW